MTIVAVIALTAVILLAAWLVGQLPVVWKRLAVVFALSWLGYGIVYLADMRAVSETVKVGIMIALGIGAIAAALFVLQPLTWGIDDYIADLDAQMEAETTEVQP